MNQLSFGLPHAQREVSLSVTSIYESRRVGGRWKVPLPLAKQTNRPAIPRGEMWARPAAPHQCLGPSFFPLRFSLRTVVATLGQIRAADGSGGWADWERGKGPGFLRHRQGTSQPIERAGFKCRREASCFAPHCLCPRRCAFLLDPALLPDSRPVWPMTPFLNPVLVGLVGLVGPLARSGSGGP